MCGRSQRKLSVTRTRESESVKAEKVNKLYTLFARTTYEP